MAKVRKIYTAHQVASKDVIVDRLELNFQEYNSKQKISNDLKEKRFSICSGCKDLTVNLTCKVLGSCKSGRMDLYQMHLNREKGGCPLGQW